MALAYLLDEHLRGPLWWAIQRHNARGSDLIDAGTRKRRAGCREPERSGEQGARCRAPENGTW